MEANFGLIRQGTGEAALVRIPTPRLRDDFILVRTIAVALNPTDWTTLDAKGDNGTLVGCDYAGIVEEVGKAVKKVFKKGDRICGFGHGGNDLHPETGTFARYVTVKGDVQMHIPDGVSFEAAASVGAGIGTTGYALYYFLGLPLPDTKAANHTLQKQPILIYGGSTATGSLAIQFARMSGFEVLTTCSPKHFELVKKRGAHAAFDYRSTDVGERIKAGTNDNLRNALDTVNLPETAAICASAISSQGGTYCNLLGLDCPRSDVKSVFFLGYDMLGDAYIFEGESYPAKPDDFNFAVKFYEVAEKLWAAGKWIPHPQRVGKGGLRGILDGMQEMREGKVSGEKLVYLVDETSWPDAK